MRIHRLIAILVITEQKGTIKAKELASSLEVSTRTIYRDIEILCEVGFPLYATTGPEGGITLSEHFNLGISSISEDQVLPLILQTLPVLPSNKNLATTIKDGFETLNYGNYKSSDNKILIDSKNWWGEPVETFDIRLIIDSLWQLQSITLTYKKMNNEISKRTVNPYGLILKGNSWYLIAYCNNAKAIRTFHCSRIEKSHLTKKHYQVPSSFILKNYWTESTTKFKEDRQDEEIYPVSVKLPIYLGSILSKYEVMELKEDNGFYMASINLFRPDIAKDEVLSLLGSCEILSPDNLRFYSKKVLLKMIDNYPI